MEKEKKKESEINMAARSEENILAPVCLCSIVFLCVSYWKWPRAARKIQNAAVFLTRMSPAQFVVSSLQKKSQVLKILIFVVCSRTCSLRDLSNSWILKAVDNIPAILYWVVHEFQICIP